MNAPFEKHLSAKAARRSRSPLAPPFRRKILFEALEPRLLLSADLAYTAAMGVALDAELKVDDIDGAAILRLIDNQSNAVLAEQLVDQDIEVSVLGGDASDRLEIGFDSATLAHQIHVNFDGGAGGVDELIGPDHANTWRLQAAGAGTLDGVSFSGVERVQGGAAEDVFLVLDPSVNTAVDGGSGSDTLVAADADNDWTVTAADAGTLNGQAFAGIENLTGGAG